MSESALFEIGIGDNHTRFSSDDCTSEKACAIFNCDTNKCQTLVMSRLILACFSLIACFAVIVTILLFRLQVQFSQRLILCLVVSGLANAIGFIIKVRDTYSYNTSSERSTAAGGRCTFQAWWLMFTQWCVLLWTFVITLDLYINIKTRATTQKYEKWYHALVWGVSLLMACIPLMLSGKENDGVTTQYGPVGPWCWVRREHSETRIFCWYFWLILINIVMYFLYANTMSMVRSYSNTWHGNTTDAGGMSAAKENEMLLEVVRPLQWYPLVYIMLSWGPLANRIFEWAHPGEASYPLALIMCLCIPLQGVANVFVYASDKSVMGNCTKSQIAAAFLRLNGKGGEIVTEYDMNSPMMNSIQEGYGSGPSHSMSNTADDDDELCGI